MSRAAPAEAADVLVDGHDAGRVTAFVPALLLVAVPLVVDPAAQAPFFSPKWMLTCTLVPLGLAITAAMTRLRWPLARWWGGWLAVAALATLVGVAPRLGVVGAPMRNFGLVTWLLAAGSFVLGASNGRSPTAVRWIVRAASVSAGVVGIVAVLDRLGVDAFGIGDLDGLTRARSTWGSPTFAAGHLVAMTPLAVVLIRSPDLRWRATGWVVSVSALIGLALTGTRGAWLGALVAALVLAWPHLADAGDRRGVAAAAIAVLLGLGVLAAISSPSLGRTTATGRVDLWNAAADAAWERPLLGSGLDTQRIVLPASFDDAFEQQRASDEIHDRAHSLILDTVLTTGVVGLVAFGALLWFTGQRVVASARRGLVGRALAAGLAGYLVHLLTAFSEATLDPLVWMLAGVAVVIGEVGGDTDGGAGPPPTNRARWLLTAGFGAITIVASVWAGRELYSDHLLADALAERTAGRGNEAVSTLEDAVDMAPVRLDLHQVRAQLAEELRNDGDDIDLDTTALRDLDAALDLAPDDPNLMIDRASVLASAGRLVEARATYEKVLAGPYPNSSRAWLGLGFVDFQEGDDVHAEVAWVRAADLAPEDPRPWVNLGLLHEDAGDTGEAREAFEHALEIEPDDSAASEGLERLDEN